MITSRRFETTISDVQRSITGADSAVDIRDTMLKNDFAHPRAATIITTWVKPIPSPEQAEQYDKSNYYPDREKLVHEGMGDIVVIMMGFEGGLITLYNRYGSLVNALEKHIEFVNLFAVGML